MPVMNEASHESFSPIARIGVVVPGGSRQIRTSCFGERPSCRATAGTRGGRPEPQPTRLITERQAAAAASSFVGLPIAIGILLANRDICNS